MPSPCREVGALLFRDFGRSKFVQILLHAFFYFVFMNQENTGVVGEEHHVLAWGVGTPEVFTATALQCGCVCAT